ncbi:uncharacterized protein [Gossypium hirsutum]|uniref:Retrovirus-related Pol polyprotein from transposon TNT 1-94 n=1 Tax=Gossypium hirsutum TaxID=3635 RepID=A0ABM2ZU47_GOSHI|nr:uncharacterized protein LOC121215510 [Gossypium hirsutum]
MVQIKTHKEKKTRKAKAKSTLFAAISTNVFTKVLTLRSAKEVWNYLKEEYEGNDRIRGMQVLNLIREFELQRMKESETIKEYQDRLYEIANKVRLLGTKFPDSRIVEKILVTVLERYEASITTLENTKDMSKLSLAELMNSLQAQEQRRLMRQEQIVEGALLARHQEGGKHKKNTERKTQVTSAANSSNTHTRGKGRKSKKDYPPCQYCEKKGHPPFRC